MSVMKEIRRFLRPVKRFAWLAWRNVIVPPVVRMNYRRVLRRIRRSEGKIRVIFPIHELAKWKLQGVFDLMKSSDVFEPMMAMSGADTDWMSPRDVVRKRHQVMREYFEKRQMPYVETYDFAANRCKSLREYKPDIVFYSQPWGHDIRQFPPVVSRYALTFYVPYFVPNYSSLWMEISFMFHCCLTGYFVMNELMSNEYADNMPKWFRSTRYIPVGHPMLDYFTEHKGDVCNERYVVYAPHWSIPHPNNPNPENYSTFLETGRFMLDYAKSHPEIKWVFKPHPTLRFTLIRTGAWTEEEVDSYFKEWEDVGTACYSSEYPAIFMQSQLMITDCGSFLAEFSATGKPLIRLVSPTAKLGAKKFNERLFNSFYNVNSLNEMKSILELLIEKRQDPKMDERRKAASEVGILDSHASEKIVQYLGSLVDSQ